MQQVDGTFENLLSNILQIPESEVTETLAMKDVDSWDSLKHMELIASLEESYGIELTFDEIVTMRSVSEIKRVLKARGALS